MAWNMRWTNLMTPNWTDEEFGSSRRTRIAPGLGHALVLGQGHDPGAALAPGNSTYNLNVSNLYFLLLLNL